MADETLSENDSRTKSEESVPEGFKMIGSRRFVDQDDVKYMLPSDAIDADRMALQHYVARHVLHGNFSAPVNVDLVKGIRVLDAGCGSGIWSLEMAKNYPNSVFTGTDISDIYPKNDIPNNCTFLKANTVKGLPFEDNTFDYVFQRLMVMAFSPEDWNAAMSELYRVCKPGGWIEIIETSSVVHSIGPEYSKLDAAIAQAVLKRGIDVYRVNHIGEMLTAAGLQGVEQSYLSLPIGWNNRLGDIVFQTTTQSISSMKPWVAPIIGWSEEEYDSKLLVCMADCPKYKSWSKVTYAFGVKPF